MDKKGEFDLQNFMITLVLFIGITVTFGFVASDMSESYEPLTGNTVSSEFTDTYNQLSELEGSTKDIQEKITDTNTGSLDAATEFFGDALNSIKLIGKSMSTSKTMINSMSTTIGVPNLWNRIFTMLLVLLVLSVIIFMIFRYRGN